MKIKTNKIQILLAECGLTNCELAKRSGLSKQTIGAILRDGNCAPKTAGKLAAGLNVHVSELIEEAK